MKEEITDLVWNKEMKQLFPHYRVLTSKFHVGQAIRLNFSVEMEFTPIKFNRNKDKIDRYIDTDDSCFQESTYSINGHVVPHTTTTVRGAVQRIECRNTKLFGDKVVWIQECSVSNSLEPPFDDQFENFIKEHEVLDFIEEHEVRELLPHYRLLTSKFRVIQSHLVNRCFKIEFIPNIKMDHI